MANKPHILLVDDEELFLDTVAFTLRTGVTAEVSTCSRPLQVEGLCGSQRFSLVMLDLMMPELGGLELLQRLRTLHPDIPVIMMTAVDEVDVAVDCMQAGAFDYLVKPVDKTRLLTTVRRALDYQELHRENEQLRKHLLDDTLRQPSLFAGLVTRSATMRRLFHYVEAVAPSSMPVLITGETGTGKELLARAVHEASGLRGDFVAVNVAGLDDALFADTLFGHTRGSFTGAERDRPGLVAKAARGTLFLDEVGDLRMESQTKLLRLLEDRSYYPIGADEPRRSEARVVVATHVNLEEALKSGRFRPDLYYRLRSHHLRIPPLRERREDIPLLADHFLKEAAEELGKGAITPPPELYPLLANQPFEGNVRQLRSLLYDAVSQHRGGVLSLGALRERLSEAPAPAMAAKADASGRGLFEHHVQLPTLQQAEEALVAEALHRAGGNQGIAADLLGMTRSALNKRLVRAKRKGEG